MNVGIWLLYVVFPVALIAFAVIWYQSHGDR